MPNVRAAPTLRRRRLGSALKAYRLDASLSGEAAASAMGWDESKISSYREREGEDAPGRCLDLLKAYGIEDAETSTLWRTCQGRQQQGWWQTYGDVVALSYKDYLTLESDAESVHVYTPPHPRPAPDRCVRARDHRRDGHYPYPAEVNALARCARRARLSSHQAGRAPQAVGHHPRGRAWLTVQLHNRLLCGTNSGTCWKWQTCPTHDPGEDLQATAHPELGLFEVVRFPAPWRPSSPGKSAGWVLRGRYGGREGVRDAFERVVAAALSVDDSRVKIKEIMEGNGT